MQWGCVPGAQIHQDTPVGVLPGLIVRDVVALAKLFSQPARRLAPLLGAVWDGVAHAAAHCISTSMRNTRQRTSR